MSSNPEAVDSVGYRAQTFAVIHVVRQPSVCWIIENTKTKSRVHVETAIQVIFRFYFTKFPAE